MRPGYPAQLLFSIYKSVKNVAKISCTCLSYIRYTLQQEVFVLFNVNPV